MLKCRNVPFQVMPRHPPILCPCHEKHVRQTTDIYPHGVLSLFTANTQKVYIADL